MRLNGAFRGKVKTPTSVAAEGAWGSENVHLARVGNIWPTGGPTDDNWSSVSSLLLFDGANNSTTFTDSKNGATITATGSPVISTAQSKFGGASLYLDGSSYLTIPNVSGNHTFAGDFTIEFWMYSAMSSGFWIGMVSTSGSNSTGRFNILNRGSEDKLYVEYNDGSNNTATSTSGVVNDSAWHHVAITRSGSTFQIWRDGSSVYSSTLSHTFGNDAKDILIGYNPFDENYFTGYIDCFRVTKGVARYTATFTPATAAFPTAGPADDTDPYLRYVQMHLHFDGESNSGIWPCEAKTNIVAGGIGPYTTDKKFGTASLRSNGTSQGHNVGSTKYIGTGDFTIEFWINPVTGGHGGAWARMLTIGANNSNGSLFIVSQGSTDPMTVSVDSYNGGYNRLIDSSVTVPNDTWSHICLQRASGTYTLFIDGVSRGTSTSTVGNDITGRDVHFLQNNTNGEIFFGSMDEFRLTVGVARYSGNFSPPTKPYPSV